MIVISILKYIFFISHILFIYLSLFFIKYWQILILQFLVIISWKLNKNRCLFTQLENYLFQETIIDLFLKSKDKNKKYIVPKYQRYFLYLSFFININYHFYNNSRQILKYQIN